MTFMYCGVGVYFNMSPSSIVSPIILTGQTYCEVRILHT